MTELAEFCVAFPCIYYYYYYYYYYYFNALRSKDPRAKNKVQKLIKKLERLEFRLAVG